VRRSRDNAPLRGLDSYERMLNTFAEQAKAYWRLWGPLGETIVVDIDAWVGYQRTHIRWLRKNYGNVP
jgi:hypothetical protein